MSLLRHSLIRNGKFRDLYHFMSSLMLLTENVKMLSVYDWRAPSD